MDFMTFFTYFNPINWINSVAPAGMGELIIDVWLLASLYFAYMIYRITKVCGKFVVYMTESKKTGRPMTLTHTAGGLYEPGIIENKDYVETKDKSKTWPLIATNYDAFTNGVMFTLLEPNKPTNLTISQLVHDKESDDPEFKKLPTAAEATAMWNSISHMKEKNKEDDNKKIQGWMIGLGALIIVCLFAYMIIVNFHPSTITITPEMIKSTITTTTLPPPTGRMMN